MGLVDKILAQPYFTLIVGIVVAMLTYNLNQKARRLNTFYDQIQSNLKVIYSPIFHDLMKIKNIESLEVRIDLLDTFFEKNICSSSNIYAVDNKKALKSFYKLFDEYREKRFYLHEIPTDDFWKRFESFYREIEKEYWACHAVINRENNWLKHIWNQSPLLRGFNQLGRHYFELSRALWVISIIFLYFAFANRLIHFFKGEYLLYKDDFFVLAFPIFILTTLLFSPSILFGMTYLNKNYSGDSVVDSIGEIIIIIWKKIIGLGKTIARISKK